MSLTTCFAPFPTVANPSFTLYKMFDFAVAEFDEEEICEGLPILAAVLLQKDKNFQLYCFSMLKSDARSQINDMCQSVTTPITLGDCVD